MDEREDNPNAQRDPEGLVVKNRKKRKPPSNNQILITVDSLPRGVTIDDVLKWVRHALHVRVNEAIVWGDVSGLAELNVEADFKFERVYDLKQQLVKEMKDGQG